MIVLDSHSQSTSTVLEQKIYDHLLHCARTELPEQMFQRFQSLFVQIGSYPEPDIRATLFDLVKQSGTKQQFLPFFNRCCFILINRWQMNPLHREWVVRLVELLSQCKGPSVMVGQPTPTGKIRFFVQEYVRSSYFQRLQQLGEFLNPKTDQDGKRPLSTLLYRYPYLYPHCLTNQEDSDDYQKMIVTTQHKANQQFQQDLSSYLTYTLLKQEKPQSVSERKAQNPTLLTHSELCDSLKHYVTKVDARGTYRDMAQQFWAPGHQPESYGRFKDSLADYVLSGIPAKFGQHRFNDQFRSYLDDLYPDSNRAAVNDFLLVRTCNQVLNFLVIESKQRPNHVVFMNLLNNLGSTVTVGLFLKVVLLCNKVKPYLERRLSILFQHYESHARGSVNWLVYCLEKLNLAWSAHFGSQNLSYIHLL